MRRTFKIIRKLFKNEHPPVGRKLSTTSFGGPCADRVRAPKVIVSIFTTLAILSNGVVTMVPYFFSPPSGGFRFEPFAPVGDEDKQGSIVVAEGIGRHLAVKEWPSVERASACGRWLPLRHFFSLAPVVVPP